MRRGCDPRRPRARASYTARNDSLAAAGRPFAPHPRSSCRRSRGRQCCRLRARREARPGALLLRVPQPGAAQRRPRPHALRDRGQGAGRPEDVGEGGREDANAPDAARCPSRRSPTTSSSSSRAGSRRPSRGRTRRPRPTRGASPRGASTAPSTTTRVRDLLGVDLRPALDFPQDDSGYGFDNNGDVLSLSPALMERYLTAAERVARAALFGPDAPGPGARAARRPRARIEPSPAVPAEYDDTGLTLRNAVHAGTASRSTASTSCARSWAASVRPAPSRSRSASTWTTGSRACSRSTRRASARSAVDRQDFTGKTRELRVRLTAGEHRLSGTIVRLFEGLPASYGGPNPSKRPLPPPREFKPRPDATPEQAGQGARGVREAAWPRWRRPTTCGWRGSRCWGRTSPPAGPSRGEPARGLRAGVAGPSARRGGAADPDAARATGLPAAGDRRGRRPARRASWRVPGRAARASRTASRSRSRRMLVSPDFLFRIERGRPRDGRARRAVRSTDHELASRLSYFLWASMPDDALLDLADQGRLREPGGARGPGRAHAARTRRRAALVEAFAGQWLQFRALESVAPDRERFPDFDTGLRALDAPRDRALFLEPAARGPQPRRPDRRALHAS